MTTTDTIETVTELKPCPCGRAPKFLNIYGGATVWMYCTGSCCNGWHVEFRWASDSCEQMTRAIEAWNNAPRGGAK